MFRKERTLILSASTALLLSTAGARWLDDLSDPVWLIVAFLWLFGVILASAFSVVRHAEHLAAQLGEPYGTLILTLSVISIEIMTITSVMLTGVANPELARDSMYAVLMIVLNGMVGCCLLLGGIRHLKQSYNLAGANAFLAVIVPLSIMGLVLPNYTLSTDTPDFSPPQSVFLVVLSLATYGLFLMIQTVRHRGDFTEPEASGSPAAEIVESDRRGVGYHALMLIAYLVPVVVLADLLAIPVDHGIANLGIPAALGGFLVALLVCSPEAMSSVSAALQNRMQRAINIVLGSALATISLTLPAVLMVSLYFGETVILGLEPEETLMLLTTLLVSGLTFASGHTSILLGAVHLLLFLVYVMLIFDLHHG